MTANAYDDMDSRVYLSNKSLRKGSYEFPTSLLKQYHDRKLKYDDETMEWSSGRNTIIRVPFFLAMITVC